MLLANPSISLQQRDFEIIQFAIAFNALATDFGSNLIFFAPYLPSSLPISLRLPDPRGGNKQQRQETPNAQLHEPTIPAPVSKSHRESHMSRRVLPAI